MERSISRRGVLAGAAGLAACSRKHKGFPGYAFVANQDRRSVAAVDLNEFSLARQIALDGAPSSVIAHPSRPAVYVLTPENGTIWEIESASLSVKRRTKPAQLALSMRLAGDGRSVWILAREPRALIRVPLDSFRADSRVPLPLDPGGFELDGRPEGHMAGVSFPAEGKVALCDLSTGSTAAPVAVGAQPLVGGFRKDGELLVAGSADRIVTMLDVPSARTVVRLPLPLQPEHFCFLGDGGQLFISGSGMDGVVIVLPFSTEVGETILAGHAPGTMATWSSPPYSYLFAANPGTGDVTVIDIDTRKLVVVLHTGGEPSQVVFTPDNRYALVLNNRSGDLAVVRTAEFTTETTQWIQRYKTGALFTVVPVGGRPAGAAVVGRA